MNKKLLILPDIHGRKFWTEIKNNENDFIIFLGDYLDPYPDEHISKKEALDNLFEIFDFYEHNKDRTILLLGNHDLGYFNREICSCRQDYGNYNYIQKIFKDNFDKFNLVYGLNLNNKFYLFSHAGINPEWLLLSDNKILFTDIKFEETKLKDFNIVDGINKKKDLLLDNNKDIIQALSYVSYYRGGFDLCSSFIWSDVREINSMYEKKEFEKLLDGTYQIFGHTRLLDKPIVKDKYACVDNSKIYIIE